jgi:pyruvate,water dikinase
MIEADCAGVCFSADPIQGRRDKVLISAAWGLGAGVVDGTIANDTYWIDRARLRPVDRHIVEQKEQISLRRGGGIQVTPVLAERRRAACLPDAWLGRIAQHAIAVETLFGRAQDMEWAVAGHDFWLLQSRPITSLPQTLSRTLPFPVYWDADQDQQSAWEPYPLDGHEKDVLLPLERDCLAAIESQREETCRFIGADRNGRLAFFNGRPYFSSLPINMKPAELRVRRQAMNDLKQRLREQNLTAWDYWGPEIIKAVERLRAVDLPELPAAALADHLEQARAVRNRHFMLHPIMWFKPETAYFEAFTKVSGLSGPEAEAVAYRLIEGEENILTRLLETLYTLAQTARKSAKVSAFVKNPTPDLSGWLSKQGGPDRRQAEDFLAQLEAFLADYGERNGNGYGSVATVCTPTWGEDPSMVLRLVAAYLDPASESPQMARARAHSEREKQIVALCQASDDEAAIAEYRRQLAYAQKAYTVLEEHNHYIDQVGAGQLRRAILAAGDYLVRVDILADRDDVFWLSWDELIVALRSGESASLEEEIAACKKQHAAWQALKPPPFLGLPRGILPKRPPLQDDLTRMAPAEDHVIRGLGASPGRVRGRARVVLDSRSMPDIARGDILVAPNAGPLWTPLLPALAGLVLDGGSLGQHAAVTAREYGVPAVLATRQATRQIPDGVWLVVDGRAGTVEIEDQLMTSAGDNDLLNHSAGDRL